MVEWLGTTSTDEYLEEVTGVQVALLSLSLVLPLSVDLYVDTMSYRVRQQNLQ